MAELDRYIPGVPCWVDVTLPDPEAAVPFYAGLFGWDIQDMSGEGASLKYFIGRIDGQDAGALASIPPEAPPVPTWNTYIRVASADETATAARDAGGAVLAEPFDVGELGRMAVIADPEGAVFSVWEPKEHRGAQAVNAHGAINFNNLHTRDPEAAETFYRAVFSWRLLPLASGTAWALAGYGDHLELLTPGLKERMEQMQAPEGFIDVVAALDPIADDDTETQAHWSVTFGIDDVDAAAAKAPELGGEVVAGPVDAPWSRTAVIRDPQGATFTASQFVPENRDIEA